MRFELESAQREQHFFFEKKKQKTFVTQGRVLRINCPACGERDSAEFSYLGDANVRRPADGGEGPTPEWEAYVYIRDNPAGRHRELWFHAAGCRLWLEVERDTITHEIFAVAAARDRR